ncbi:MAG TPA: hypothetical protein VMV69_21675 [Pirellulales bacterium]|nr:hypothetical protein [Pirellulales bacterium]
MNVLYLGDFHRYCTEAMIADVFERLGHGVVRVSTRDATLPSLAAECERVRPDIFLFAKAMFVGATDWPDAAEHVVRLLTAIRPHVGAIVGWHWDLTAAEFSHARFAWMARVCPHVDLFAMSDGHTARQLPNTFVLRDGSFEDVDTSPETAGYWPDYGRPEAFAGDALFVGSLYRERRAWWEHLQRTRVSGRQVGSLRLDCVGSLGVAEVRGPRLTRLVRSYKIVLQPPTPYFPHYWSDRITVMAGHGALMGAPKVEGMEADGWIAGRNYLELPIDVEGYAAALAGYVSSSNPGFLAAVRRAGFEHAMRHCSWTKRVEALLAELAGKRR